jgi:aspartyl aminopeptidase
MGLLLFDQKKKNIVNTYKKKRFFIYICTVRNDCPCGSTIGPTISALTGIRTVDAGMPQLSMHSCREVMGVQDLYYGLQLMSGFFQHFRTIDDTIDKTIT